MSENITLTRRWPAEVEAEMGVLGNVSLNTPNEPFDRDKLALALTQADVLCPTVTDQLDGALLSQSGLRTRLIANFGVGFNHIDIEAAVRAGIRVTNTPGVLTNATAEARALKETTRSNALLQTKPTDWMAQGTCLPVASPRRAAPNPFWNRI